MSPPGRVEHSRLPRAGSVECSLQGGRDRVNRIVSVLILLGLAACGSDSPSGPSSLGIEDLVVGTGPAAVAGDTVTVHYVGRFTDGKQFDSSYAASQPFTFRLGVGQVIAGWDQGVPGMKVGGKRRLTVPASLAYGQSGYGIIPPNAALVFDVGLLSI